MMVLNSYAIYCVCNLILVQKIYTVLIVLMNIIQQIVSCNHNEVMSNTTVSQPRLLHSFMVGGVSRVAMQVNTE